VNLSRRGFISGIAACLAAARVGIPMSVAAPVAATLTSVQAALKEFYPQSRFERAIYQDSPLFALLPKYEGWR
jgi:hypothetical protein